MARVLKSPVGCKSLEGPMDSSSPLVIHVYTVCWNEEQMMPHFLSHYAAIAQRIVVYDNMSTDSTPDIVRSHTLAELRSFDTKGIFDDVENIRIKNSAYQDSRGVADFVVVVDTDEFIHHPDLQQLLLDYKRTGVTLPKTRGFDMTGWRFPPPQRRIVDAVRMGREREHYAKKSIFDPSLDINFSVGAHKCKPVGNVVESGDSDIALLHFHYVGLLRCVRRHRVIRGRLGQWHHTRPEVAVQYKWGSLKVVVQFLRTRLRSHDVVRSRSSLISKAVAPAYRVRDATRRRRVG
jgi:glycosyltransferase involved in cell wall biosynthesis